MHPRNPYQHPPDFEALSESYPALRQHLIGHTIDFHDDAAQRCLTGALLHRDFNIAVQLPSDRLCPPVPNRLNYVLWIQDLVRAHVLCVPRAISDSFRRVVVHGIDVGTGASAIYPLLACSLEPSWKFLATELDQSSYTYAQKNIVSNSLSDRIRVVKVNSVDADSETSGEAMRQAFGFDRLFEQIPGLELGADPDETDTLVIEFTMCNPPFYGTEQEVDAARDGRDKDEMPAGVCTGAPVEMITPGGEARFVREMVRESVCAMSRWDVQEDDSEAVQTDEGVAGSRRKRRRREGGLGESSKGVFGLSRTDIGSPRRAHEEQGLAVESLDFHQTTTQLGARSKSRLKSRWYTSMLGKLSSVAEVVDVIREHNITNYAITEFVQGKTRRWAIGWSLGAFRLPDATSRIDHPNPTLHPLMPPRSTLRFPIPQSARTSNSYESVVNALGTSLACIEGAIVEEREVEQQVEELAQAAPRDPPSREFLVWASCDSWSRRARRKWERSDGAGAGAGAGSSADTSRAGSLPVRDEWEAGTVAMSRFFGSAALVCICGVGDRDGTGLGVEFRWVYGRERALFESFVSHVGRRTVGR